MSGFTELVDYIKSPFEYNVKLEHYTSLKIGGPCEILLKIQGDEDLIKILSFLREKGYPYFLLGNGTNLLVSDEGFSGVVLKLGDKYQDAYYEKGKNGIINVNVGAGKSLPSLAIETARKGLLGLEWGCGIPGTLGGACIMNAGAFEGEMSQVVSGLEGIDFNTGKKVYLNKEDLYFQYRSLNMGDKNIIITRVWLSLKEQKNNQDLMDKVKRCNIRRRENQPSLPNAGSVFKNPPGDYAGRLLEKSGMKGYKLGGVKFSEKHANFIVNENNGKAKDVWKLINIARRRVREFFSYDLSLELQVLGEF